jgi:hypothetical protein
LLHAREGVLGGVAAGQGEPEVGHDGGQRELQPVAVEVVAGEGVGRRRVDPGRAGVHRLQAEGGDELGGPVAGGDDPGRRRQERQRAGVGGDLDRRTGRGGGLAVVPGSGAAPRAVARRGTASGTARRRTR